MKSIIEEIFKMLGIDEESLEEFVEMIESFVKDSGLEGAFDWKSMISFKKEFAAVEEINEDFKVFYFPEDGTPYSMDFQRNGCFEESFGPGFFDEAGNSYRALFKLERGL